MKRSVLLIGVNNEGKILLHHKTADASANANLWVLLGGSIERGESPEVAIRREMKEELYILVNPSSFRTYIHEELWGKVERNIFYDRISQNIKDLRLAENEGDGLNFFSSEEMEKLPMNPKHLDIIKEFAESETYRKMLATGTPKNRVTDKR